MTKKHIIAFSICLTWLCCSKLGQTLQTRRVWKRTFQTDVEILGHFFSHQEDSQLSCGIACSLFDTCLSFGWQAASGSCWLYDHPALFRLSGPPAPATAYFWALAPRCPTDRNYMLQAGVCFRVFPDLRNWTQAAAVCAADGGHLYVGDTPAKLDLLLGKFSNGVLLGGSDDEIEGQWYWVDGKNGPFRWGPTQPDNYQGSQDVTRMWTDGTIDDEWDQTESQFACEIPML